MVGKNSIGGSVVCSGYEVTCSAGGFSLSESVSGYSCWVQQLGWDNHSGGLYGWGQSVYIVYFSKIQPNGKEVKHFCKY